MTYILIAFTALISITAFYNQEWFSKLQFNRLPGLSPERSSPVVDPWISACKLDSPDREYAGFVFLWADC